MSDKRLWGALEDERDLSEAELRELMCEIGRRMWLKDMADCNAGNLSCRLGPERILATPTLIAKGFMEPDDLVVLDRDGRQTAGKRRSTSEVRLHLAVYARCPGAGAVVHAHPRNALVFAARNEAPPAGILTEVEMTIGEVALAPYATPGTQAFADSVSPLVPAHCAVLLSHHGALTYGRGLLEAYWRMETLETYCGVILAAAARGPLPRIPEARMAEIRALRSRSAD